MRFMRMIQRYQTFRRPTFSHSLSSSSPQENLRAEPLLDRGLIKLSGPDVYDFIQGLMTNDISHIQSSLSAMYSMFLNTRGRVLFDTIIYQTTKPGTLLIECDSSVRSSLAKHLQLYRLRKKIDIDILEDEKVWTVYDPSQNGGRKIMNPAINLKDKLVERAVSSQELEPSNVERKESFIIKSSTSEETTLIFRDPRIPDLGLRVVCPATEDVSQLLGVERGSSYRSLRYWLGVGEGMNEIIPGESFPLESNCDYLHGVSFHKGCYIGQELTARVHHTGVVRKRLMPIFADSPITNEVSAKKQDILNDSGKAVGKLRSIEGLAALGLLRISEVLSAKSLTLCNTNLKTWQPSWWPKEAPKELEPRDK